MPPGTCFRIIWVAVGRGRSSGHGRKKHNNTDHELVNAEARGWVREGSLFYFFYV